MNLISGTAVTLLLSNIDTDQIIPAKFLNTQSKSGLGNALFANWRYNEDYINQSFVLNRISSAQILFANENFACGSSREHAVWALMDYGIQAIVCHSAADIFKSNAQKNKCLVIELAEEIGTFLKHESFPCEIDILNKKIISPFKTIEFKMEAFQHYCFLNDLNEIDFILKHEHLIDLYESNHETI